MSTIPNSPIRTLAKTSTRRGGPRGSAKLLGLALLVLTAGGCASAPAALDVQPRTELVAWQFDPSCAETQPCPRVYIRGRAPAGLAVFVAVAPLTAAPKMWIQPPILVRRDGSFEGLAYLGSETQGAGQRFQLLVLAHRDPQRFRTEEILTDVPLDCTVSDPVTVQRVH